MLRPFNCPKIDQGWAEADQHVATVVVPKVLSTSSIVEKNVFYVMVYTHTSQIGMAPAVQSLEVEQESIKSPIHYLLTSGQSGTMRGMTLDKRAKHCEDIESIGSLSAKFHHSLRQYTQISRAKRASTKKSA